MVSRARAFSLLEVAVALFLLFAGLMMTMTVTWQYRDVARRIDAHTEALRALEIAHETMRAVGPLPTTADGRIIANLSLPEADSAEALTLWAELTPTARRGLIAVRLRASYIVDRRPYQRFLDTYLWLPV